MKIMFLLVGKKDSGWVKEAFTTYLDRLKHYAGVELRELPAFKAGSKTTFDQQKEEEGRMILQTLQTGDRLVLLDEKGKMFTSAEFSGWIARHQMNSVKRCVFVVGGPFGFSEEVYNKADEKISLSAMTFSHQMIRPLLAEQVYRAFTILKGEKYHHH
jgi:23S rRNA (pseudouridine1915-N3)-methyltransferase